VDTLAERSLKLASRIAKPPEQNKVAQEATWPPLEKSNWPRLEGPTAQRDVASAETTLAHRQT